MTAEDLAAIYSPDAERSVLGCMLLGAEAIQDAKALLSEDSFYNPGHQSIYKAMLNLDAKRIPVDLVTLKNELESMGRLEEVGGDDNLFLLADKMSSVLQAPHYCQIVADKFAMRRLEAVARDAVATIYKGGAPEDVVSILSRATDVVAGRAGVMDVATLVANLSDDELRGVTSGHPVLDSLTRVGFVRGQVTVISAVNPNSKSTGARKSWFGIGCFVAAALSGQRAMYATFADLTRDQVCRRILKQICGMGGRPKLRLDRVPDFEEALSTISDPYGEFTNALVYDGAMEGMDVERLIGAARRVKRKSGLSLLVVDYIQQVHARGVPRHDRTRQLEYVSDCLKVFAAQEDVAVLVLSQLTISKRGEDEAVMTQYSSQVEHDAGMILMLQGLETGGVKWHCSKNRFGKDNVSGHANWDEQRCCFRDFRLTTKSDVGSEAA